MPQLNKSLPCKKGENLFRALKDNQIAIASSCGGEGICGKCVVSVVSSDTELPSANESEINLKKRMGIDPQLRLSCQIYLSGNITIKTTYW